MTMLQKLLAPFREFGAGAGLLYAIDRVLSRLSSHTRLHVYELIAQPIREWPLLPRRSSSLDVREIAPGDRCLAAMPVRPGIMSARIAGHARCLGVFRGDELAGYMWFRTGSYDEDEVRCTYVLQRPDRAVFDFDFYIFPEHRMGRAFATLWNGANEYLYRRGVRETYSRMTRFNVASRRAHRHLGAGVVGRAAFLVLGRIEAMVATRHPYLHLSWREASRARLWLDVEDPREPRASKSLAEAGPAAGS
jgi:hypothetical protein